MRTFISRIATFSWSPANVPNAEPLIATGTLSGALDESFSNDSVLEIWKPQFGAGEAKKPIATATTGARFNRVAWGYVCPERPMGVIAAGLENGELILWDAKQIIDGAENPLIFRNNQHTGPIKGLHFNPKQPHLLASGGVNGEIYIWDLSNPGKPYSPGARSTKLDEITALSWNPEVPHILATSSSSGYTVVWNLREKKELTALAYGGGAGTTPGNVNGMNSSAAMAIAGGRRGMGALCWHPEQPTRLATASDDDASPLVMLWDLRNSRAPEKILTGHNGGVLSLSWCKQDADLLLSCGKDNRTICWNPQSGQIVGELPASQNWSYDVQFCPKNPTLVAVASFDGRITFNSLQDTNPSESTIDTSAAPTDVNDVFDSLPAQSEANNRGISLSQPPKWLKRPISAVFGFGGQLVTTSNLPGDKGQTQSAVVHLRGVVTEPSIAARAQRLQDAINSQSLAEFCAERSKDATTRPDDVANWKALQTLFQADNRDELVALLGFSKEDVAARVASSIGAFKQTSAGALAPGLSLPNTPPAPPVPATSAEAITTATNIPDGDVPAVADVESDGKTPPASANAVSNAFDLTAPAADVAAGAAKETEANLFGTHESGDAADLFSSLGRSEDETTAAPAAKSALPDYLTHDGSVTPGGVGTVASVAATAGSPRALSVASEGPRTDTFRIYPDNEAELDKLVTRALVLGDFESAVSLCLSTDRHADAILLAVRGGPDLLARTQKAYFERKTTTLPYLRLFQSIVSDDLSDVVQNADLNEWQEIFVVVCTFAKRNEDFVYLVEQLGQRLEFQYTSSTGPAAKTYRKNAVLCYLAAGKLEKVAGMWIDEMKEEESALQNGQATANGVVNGDSGEAASSLYSAHAEALQTFMEKITVFQSAVNYVDSDLTQQPAQSAEEAAARTYKLASLYDRIVEYVDLLADQGLIAPALTYINQTPQDYRVGDGSVGAMARERLRLADQAKTGGKGAAAVAAQAAAAASSTAGNAYTPQQTLPPQAQQGQSTAAPSSYNAYGQTNAYQPYGGVNAAGYDSYAPSSTSAYGVPSQIGYAQAQQQQAQQPQYQNSFQGGQQQQFQAPQQSAYAPVQPLVPAPPPPIMGGGASEVPQQHTAPPPPPPKKPDGGWNDIPASLAPKRSTSAMSNRSHAPQPITSPFPNAPTPYAGGGGGGVAPPQMSYNQSGPAAAAVPPPPRGMQPARGVISPPPGNAFGRPAQVGGNQGPPPPQQQQPPFQQQQAAPPRPPPSGPPRGGTPAGGARPGQPLSPPIPSASGPYAPAPGQVPVPPPPGVATNNFGGGGAAPPTMQQQQLPFQRPPMPAMPPSGPPSNVPMRSVTPGAGAGPPPARSATPSGKAAPKYPPGDRSHVPESGKPILATFTKELARIKSSIPPTQRRYVDDAERRMNLLLDQLNCATLEPRVVQALLGICQAIEARNQQAALAQHVQLFSSTSGDVSTGLVGLKFVISKINQ